MKTIDKEGQGVIVFLRQTESPKDMVAKIESIIRDESNQEEDHPDELRTYGIGAQILADLGVRKMSVLSAPKKFHALAGFGLEVVEYYSD
jgi:3,4-dihydroxy 2-butanone 4-phosphate synthase/GTP cyclohydrolase II